jgi:hypothetical protein
VRAARTIARGKSVFTKDFPAAKATYDKMAPYLPSLARLVYIEAREKMPAPKEAWRSLMRRIVPKAEEEAGIPAAHQHISAPAPRGDHEADTVQLQIVG